MKRLSISFIVILGLVLGCSSKSAGAIGDGCTADTDCASGTFCSTSDPGGQCLKNCAQASDCPAGSVCTDESKCYKSCTNASDCPRAGYACVSATSITNQAVTDCDIA